MKASEIREMPSEELVEKIGTMQMELIETKLKGSVSGEPLSMRTRTQRRDIARIKTVLRERELAK